MSGPEDLSGQSYEELLAALEDLTARISSGDVGIEEATSLYERAVIVHRAAAARLAAVEARIERLREEPG